MDDIESEEESDDDVGMEESADVLERRKKQKINLWLKRSLLKCTESGESGHMMKIQ